MESGDRSFTVILIKKAGKKLKSDGGRYISKTPDSAARKAFSQYYRQHKKAGRFSLEIHIKETTQNSSKKDFKYRVSKVNDPIDISRGCTVNKNYYQILPFLILIKKKLN